MPSSYPRDYIEVIDMTGDSSSSPPPPSPPSRAQYTQSSSQSQGSQPREPIRDYFQRIERRRAIIADTYQQKPLQSSHERKPSPYSEGLPASTTLSGIAGTTSEIRSQRIQDGLITGEQRISTWPKKKISSSTTQVRPSGETQICVEVTFYIWHCSQARDSTRKSLQELHSAAHTFLPRTIPSIDDFIEKDLLPALDLSICPFQRQDGDQLRLATSIKKKQLPIFLSYDNTSRHDSKDIMKRFIAKGNEHQVNVIIVRTEQDKKETTSKRKPIRQRTKKSHQVGIQIKQEEQGEQVEEDDDHGLPSPSEIFYSTVSWSIRTFG
jgi:hypothetical protein